MTDFSTPRRMSAGAFMIMFLDYLRKCAGFLILAIVPLLFRSDEQIGLSEISVRVVVSFGVILGLSILLAFMKYYFRKFHVENDKLIFTHGFAAKSTTSIPLQRIHTLRTKKDCSTVFLI